MLAAALLSTSAFQMPLAPASPRVIARAPRSAAGMMADDDSIAAEEPPVTTVEIEQMEKYMAPKPIFLGVFDTATPAGAAGGTAVVTIVFGIFIEFCKAVVGDDSIFDLFLY